MMTSQSTPTEEHLYRIDKFKVPPSARDEFLTRVRETHGFLSCGRHIHHSGWEKQQVNCASIKALRENLSREEVAIGGDEPFFMTPTERGLQKVMRHPAKANIG